ncbi:MAG: purine-binding chemotaxis protein CheW [Desulfuromonadales bacterium]|nr:purine-binding chemotaxis protein CheW [Desulfuromonadales bacterium]NIR33988.1 purine-binding chemotaxis protein CheW [Desulfuromonadales bacterium]NIS42660.1 purine-binding chemotaxis protein CheW [Desulfuromonadales bacterium]
MERQQNTEPQEQEGARREIQLACFRVGPEMYALDIMRIKEIIRPQKLTPVPKAPAFIEGVINLRGAVIPVVDLRKRFDQPINPDNRGARILICTLAGKVVGLIADEVTEVRRYTRQDVQPAPQFLKGKGAEYFLGVCRSGEDLVMLIDLEKILTSEEKIDLEKVQPLPEKTDSAEGDAE